MTIVRDILYDVTQDPANPGSLTSTEAITRQGDSVTVTNSAGSKTVTGTTSVTGNTATVALAATAAIVTTAQELTGVAPTGTYVSKVTFTVASGVISAIALS